MWSTKHHLFVDLASDSPSSTGPVENMGTVGTGRAEHRVTVGNRPNNYLLAAPLTLFDQGVQVIPFLLGCPNQL